MKNDLKKKLEEFINNEYEAEMADNTIKSYHQEILAWINWLKDDDQITKKIMIEYKKYLKDKFQPNTTNHHIVVLNKFLSFCGYDIRLEKLEIQNQTSLNNQLEMQEHRRLLKWALKMKMDDMYLIMKIFAKTGIRVIEIRFFTIEKLSWSMQIENKGKFREIIVPRDLIREIRKYCRKKNIRSGYIFRAPRDKTKPLPVSTLEERIKRIARKARINPKKIHPHAWRHLYAKEAKKAGVEDLELKDLLGHARLETTAIYAKTSSKEKREKIEKM